MEPGILIRPSTIGMILISMIGVPVFAQTNGNITTPVVPQGTSLNVSEDIAFPENESTTTSGNITTPVVPQGTSLDITNDSSEENIPQTGAGNIQEPMAPG
jgi:hypothetical protein